MTWADMPAVVDALGAILVLTLLVWWGERE